MPSIERPSSYREVKTCQLVYKTNQLMLYRANSSVCSEIRTKHINTTCWRDAEHTVTAGLTGFNCSDMTLRVTTGPR